MAFETEEESKTRLLAIWRANADLTTIIRIHGIDKFTKWFHEMAASERKTVAVAALSPVVSVTVSNWDAVDAFRAVRTDGAELHEVVSAALAKITAHDTSDLGGLLFSAVVAEGRIRGL